MASLNGRTTGEVHYEMADTGNSAVGDNYRRGLIGGRRQGRQPLSGGSAGSG